MTDGVIVGCDRNQEWLLPWWWSHYSKHSFLPVAFVDFGMSSKAKEWCYTRGTLIPLHPPKDFIVKKEKIKPHLVEDWEKSYQQGIWLSREGWLKKPLAMLKTPFDRTLWLDLDCEIAGSITPLFQKIHSHSGIAMAKEPCEEGQEPSYNSGVVVFSNKSPLISKWAEVCIEENHHFLTDQNVINFLIQEGEIEIAEIPAIYNWRVSFGVNVEAVIIHWIGEWGKEIINLAMQR